MTPTPSPAAGVPLCLAAHTEESGGAWAGTCHLTRLLLVARECPKMPPTFTLTVQTKHTSDHCEMLATGETYSRHPHPPVRTLVAEEPLRVTCRALVASQAHG